MSYGASIDLDSLSLARYLGGRLVVVAAGDNDTVYDDIRHLVKNFRMDGIDFARGHNQQGPGCR